MTMESDLAALLKTVCTRTFPDFAPSGTAAPYIVYQAIGGQAMQYMDGTAADKRSTLVQIDAWAGTRAAALVLIRQAEAALIVAGAFVAQPEGESSWDTDPDGPLYGCTQDFRVISAR